MILDFRQKRARLWTPLGPPGDLHEECLACIHHNNFAETNAQLNKPTLTCLLSSVLSRCSLSAPFLKEWCECRRWHPRHTHASSWHLVIVRDDNHQDQEIWGKVTTPLLEFNTTVPKKTMHWFAPDLKRKSANIEISISAWLGYRAPGSYEARKRSTNILYSLQSHFLLYTDGPTAMLSEKRTEN